MTASPLTVDARGHRCPIPTLKLRRALEMLAVGEAVLLLADDPLARIDLPHFAAANGHRVEILTIDAGVIRAVIRKGVGSDR